MQSSRPICSSSTSTRGRGRPASRCRPAGTRRRARRGCTPQSCAFRDEAAAFAELGAALAGLSAQSLAEQEEFAGREHIPYPVVADERLALAGALGLPTFEIAGMRLYRRLTLVARAGRIEQVFYPVFPPDRNAADVLAFLSGRA